MLFSERIEKRLALWWGVRRLGRFYSPRDSLHRLKERYTRRSKDDVESKWRCCEFWQRSLHYKWNAREFAEKHGCQIPQLYWFGKAISRLDFDSLPDYYVIKPVSGWSRNDVYVMAAGVDLLTDGPYTKTQLRERLRQIACGLYGQPILIEELVTDNGDYKLPTEYRLHMFGETIGAIQVVQRSARRQDTKHRFYTEQWKMFEDQMITNLPQGNYTEPPRCLDEMLMSAKKLGRAYGTYVRIDFYASKRGCVFGEFTSFPNRMLTEYADEYFGALWQKIFPGII